MGWIERGSQILQFEAHSWGAFASWLLTSAQSYGHRKIGVKKHTVKMYDDDDDDDDDDDEDDEDDGEDDEDDEDDEDADAHNAKRSLLTEWFFSMKPLYVQVCFKQTCSLLCAAEPKKLDVGYPESPSQRYFLMYWCGNPWAPCTPVNFYSRQLLQQNTFTPGTLDNFYIRHLWHQTTTNNFYTRHPFTPDTCTGYLLHQKPFAPETFHTRHLLYQTIFAIKDTKTQTQKHKHRKRKDANFFWTQAVRAMTAVTVKKFYSLVAMYLTSLRT